MYDTTRSFSSDLKERAIAASATISEEGQCLIYVDAGDGTFACSPSTGTAADYATSAENSLVAGFAVTDALKVATNSAVEEFTIPAAAPYTVQLRNQNIILADTYVYNNTAAAVMAQACPLPAATQRCIDLAGLVTFNAAEAGNSVSVQYRYDLTVQEVMEIFHERSINNRAQDFFSSVSLMAGEGEIFTTMYDASQAYAPLANIYSGAGGLLTSAAGGAVVGIVSSVPSVDDAMLGVKYTKTA